MIAVMVFALVIGVPLTWSSRGRSSPLLTSGFRRSIEIVLKVIGMAMAARPHRRGGAPVQRHATAGLDAPRRALSNYVLNRLWAWRSTSS